MHRHSTVLWYEVCESVRLCPLWDMERLLTLHVSLRLLLSSSQGLTVIQTLQRIIYYCVCMCALKPSVCICLCMCLCATGWTWTRVDLISQKISIQLRHGLCSKHHRLQNTVASLSHWMEAGVLISLYSASHCCRVCLHVTMQPKAQVQQTST